VRLCTWLASAMLAFVFVWTPAQARQPADETHSHTLHSTILNEDRSIRVYAPANLDSTDVSLPVIYALDGDSHLAHLHMVSRLAYFSGYPNVIIVSVENTDRERDMMFAPTGSSPGGGGAENFLHFIQDELIPFVESEYPVSDYRVLFGHSASGGFGAFAITAAPALFDAYMLATPNVHWRDFQMIDRLESTMNSGALDHTAIYVTLANETGDEAEGVRRFAELIETANNPLWRFRSHPDESHTSLPLVTGHYGLKFIFADFQLSPDVRAQGLTAIIDYYARLGERFSYDPRVPQRILLDYGYALLADEDAPGAEAVFRHFLAAYEGNPLAMYGLGDSLEALGRYGEAAEQFERITWMDPGLVERAAALRERDAQD